MNDLSIYRGACIYPVQENFEGIYEGCKFQGSTIEEVKSKLDEYIDSDRTIFKKHPQTKTFIMLEEDEQDKNDPEWVVTFYLGDSEIDDSIDDSSLKEASVYAKDFETAVKYAQQYLKKMQLDEETREQWLSAEILSVQLR